MKTSSAFNAIRLGLILCFCTLAGIAQNKSSTSPSGSSRSFNSTKGFEYTPEKIYLQFDNRVYTSDQTVWFKAIVTRASDHILSNATGVLHVELIDQNESIVEKKLIRLIGGVGDGFIQLSPGYADGIYQIRAYTEWNRNFGSDFFFTEYIRIYSEEASAGPDAIQNIVLSGSDNQRRIRATINPRSIDSLHSKDLTVYIASGEKHDTIKVSRTDRNNYQLDYPVPPGSNFLTLKLNTKNNSNYSRTIVLDENYLDLQFLPESGEMVHGIPSLLGIKSLDGSGKGLKLEGEILNSKNDILTTFASNELGMASVLLINPDSTERYIARIKNRKNAGVVYPLPSAAAKGNVLAVRKLRERIYLKVSSNYLQTDSVLISALCRGQFYFDFKGRLQNGEWEFSVPNNILPEGLISFTLMNSSRTPMAERLYFNERPKDRLQIQLSSDKTSYTQRELAKLSIATVDTAGTPVPSDLSVMVINTQDLDSLHTGRQNILSYLLLSSDLRGRIETPGFYFKDSVNRHWDLDALLLTQGWRKYKYDKPPGSITFQPEKSVTVSGYVGAALNQRKEKVGIDLTMMIFSKPPHALSQLTDSLGRFNFNLDQQEGHTVEVLVQSKNKAGKLQPYQVVLDKKTTPEVSFDPVLTIQKPDSVELAYVSKSITAKKAGDAYIRATEGISLDEVVVTETALSPQKKLVEEKYGKAKTVIAGDLIRKGEEKWSYGLYSVLQFKFPQVRITRDTGIVYAHIPNGEKTLVVIDGIPVKTWDYNLIPGIPPSEVKSFELIPYAKNFTALYCDVMTQCGFDAPTIGNVIAIYTFAGRGLFGANATVGLSKYTVPVFAAPRDFYAPKHENLTPADWKKPDRRTLVHWQPLIVPDSLGKSVVSFYNGDNMGKQLVIVEAISGDGRIGYKELKYGVRKRE